VARLAARVTLVVGRFLWFLRESYFKRGE